MVSFRNDPPYGRIFRPSKMARRESLLLSKLLVNVLSLYVVFVQGILALCIEPRKYIFAVVFTKFKIF